MPHGPSASVSNVPPSEEKPHCLVPLASLEDSEKDTLQSTAHFHGIVRNNIGVFVVFNGNRTTLPRIPHPPPTSTRILHCTAAPGWTPAECT
ncbi:unnamed protein product [Mycena citricolor]|uniref:Uncharacterized protein n=1 Tax=Mycena citricolor TaxID=2018698 RepID=A0AAD2HHA4_9AGAR|nr:unnamed protein product [Mycena citricolor]